MVSMLPNSQLYDLTYTYRRSLCDKPVDKYEDYGTIYDKLRTSSNFKKTVALIDKANMSFFYRQVKGPVNGGELSGITLFITDDSHIPDKFVETADRFVAASFLKSYTLDGVADINYLVQNGTSVYNTRLTDNPMLCVVKADGKTPIASKNVEITINRVGRVVKEFGTTNGNIIELDNIAKIGYIN